MLESVLASLGIVCSIMFSPSRHDDLMLVVCDHLWSFVSFLFWLVSHSAPAKWDLSSFPARSKLLERLKRRGCLVSCHGLSYCVGPLLLPAANALAWGGLASRHSLLSTHPGSPLCHQYLACFDGCQWLSRPGRHLAELSSGFKDCFALSCS